MSENHEIPLTRPRQWDQHCNRDPFLIDGIDPAVLACVPPDPYVLRQPRTRVQAGDIRLDTQASGLPERVWRPVETAEIGHLVPMERFAYGYVCALEGYVSAADGDTIESRDIFWCDGEWQSVGWYDAGAREEAKLAGKFVKDVKSRWSLFAKPVKGGKAVREMAGGYRTLHPGERLRRGDITSYGDLAEWVPVAEELRGEQVPVATEENGYAMYGRPRDAKAQSWYVKEGAAAGGLGGASDPFPSIEVAIEAIEGAARATGTAPLGMIYDIGGRPLMAYDLPEPPLTVPRTPMEPLDTAVEEFRSHDDAESIRAIETAMVVPAPQIALPRPLGAAKINENWEMLYPGMEIREYDLEYHDRYHPGKSLWYPVEPARVNDEVRDGEILARPKPEKDLGREAILSRLDKVEDRLKLAMRMLRGIARDLRGQS